MGRRTARKPDEYLISSEEIKDIFNNSLTKWSKKYPHRPWASQSACARLISLEGQLPERWEEKSGNLSFYAKSGIAMEDEINRIFGRAKIFICTDYKLPDELMGNIVKIGGKIDSVFKIDDNDYGLLEIKTIGSVESKKRANLNQSHINALLNGQDITLSADDNSIIKTISRSSPKKSHKAQLETYCSVTGCNTAFVTLFSRNVVDTWDFFGDNKPSIDFHYIDVSDVNLSKRIGSIIYAQRCIDEGYVAEIPKGMAQSTCTALFCEHYEYCWGNDVINLPHIPESLSNSWKLDSFEQAKQYISRRPERYERFKELMKEVSKNNN